MRVMPGGVPMSWLTDLCDGWPPFVAEGDGAWFIDVDGHRYLDVNIADTSMFCGYGPPAVVRAVSSAVRTGTQFLLPGEDAIVVARRWRSGTDCPSGSLRSRQRRPTSRRCAWLGTSPAARSSSCSTATMHGHSDEMQTTLANGSVVDEAPGLAPGTAVGVRLAPFNDADALRAALRDEQVACVLAEPANDQ